MTWALHKSLEDSRCFIQDYAFLKYEKGELEPYGIVLKQENWVIGTVGCSWCPQEKQNMILSYTLAYEYWGNGFMTEAAKAVVAYAFETQKPHLIQAWCLSENKASSRIMQETWDDF